jgi:glycylpeptide N-tetradecanoyltransferase
LQKKNAEGGHYQTKKMLKKVQQLYDTHDFWDSQPVPKSTDQVTDDDFNKEIDQPKTVEEIRKEPLDIPAGFHWAIVDMENETECQEVYELLT